MKAKVVFYVTGEDDAGEHFKHDWQQCVIEISPKETDTEYRQELFDAAGKNIAEYLGKMAKKENTALDLLAASDAALL